MSCPRIEVDYATIGHNARTLVRRLGAVGVGVTGVTKVMRGDPRLAATMLAAGVESLGESRIDNIERLRTGGIGTVDRSEAGGASPALMLIRSPMPSQVERVVAGADISCNSEISVLGLLSEAAVRRGLVHGVIVMVEMGDLREGVLADDALATVAAALDLPGLEVRGIGTNLACRSGVVPDSTNMEIFSDLADDIEQDLGIALDYVSGGNSANLGWILGGAAPGRVDNLRLGEAILLGRDPLDRRPIEGLGTEGAFLVGEVIESIRKPRDPWGRTAQAAFGSVERRLDGADGRGAGWQTIVAVGQQDTDPAGLTAVDGARIVGASSDHLVLETTERFPPGHELSFGVDYAALLRALSSPYVSLMASDDDRATERRVA